MVRLTSSGARPTDGSSTSRIFGASISARPSASICCSPPLMRAGELACAARRSRGKVSKQKSRVCGASPRGPSRRNAPSSRFSSTVSCGNRRRPSGTSAMPRSTISSVVQPTRSCSTPSISATMRRRSAGTSAHDAFDQRALAVAVGAEQHHGLAGADVRSRRPRSRARRRSRHGRPRCARLLAKVGPLHFRVADRRPRDCRRRSSCPRPARRGAARSSSPPP